MAIRVSRFMTSVVDIGINCKGILPLVVNTCDKSITSVHDYCGKFIIGKNDISG